MRHFYLSILILLNFSANILAKAFPLGQWGIQEFEAEVDPYYSAIDWIVPLTQEAVPVVDPSQESGVYGYLLKNLYKPRFGLLEASLNPLPILGVYTKQDQRKFYDRAGISSNVNLISIVTNGFREPGAVSFFLGNVANFKSTGEDQPSGKGYSGYLLSYGNYHIYDNSYIQDHWIETEIKLKGSNNLSNRTLSWSFRVGGKYHLHPEIRDLWYFSIMRDRTDFDASGFSLLQNSNFEYRVDFDYMRLKFTRYLLLLGKKFPLHHKKAAITFSVGLLREVEGNYTGKLAASAPTSEWSFIFRPNLSF